MRSQVEILEDLFKLDTHSQGVGVEFCSSNSTITTRLSLGIHHYQFEVPWGLVNEQYDHFYARALKDFTEYIKQA